jgi:hypothetical protein
MMEVLRWVICVLFGVPCALAVLANLVAIVTAVSTRHSRPCSLVLPIVAGPICSVACLVCPVGFVQSLAWCPLLLDLSFLCFVPGFLGFLWCAVVGRLFQHGEQNNPNRDA